MPRIRPRHSEPTDLSGLIAREINPPPIADISVQRLIDDGLIALYREIKNLLALTAAGKLEANDARDLRDHLKLLFELKDRERDTLDGITDEDIEAQAKAVLAPEVTDDSK